ncbi:MAG: ankyrin repeat domain-containing protein [Synergistaceae bacterium]|nr:ankyrin repeat domain-containing protein [Synergistaceae bacterium]
MDQYQDEIIQFVSGDAYSSILYPDYISRGRLFSFRIADGHVRFHGSPLFMMETMRYLNGESRLTRQEFSVMICAVRGDSDGLAEILAHCSPNLDARTLEGQTAIMLALDDWTPRNPNLSGAEECVKILLEHGASPNITDEEGDNVLARLVYDFTAGCGTEDFDRASLDTIAMLLEHGADPNMPGKNGITPLDDCCDSADNESRNTAVYEAIDLLKKFGAKLEEENYHD